uniref:EF-hand domain-containing protein n=1 Tax=Strombidium rassoulzadegani TaxID=1082188 RepID=A0A7S3FV94_9SPIT|mmetsp:Transcript_11004/g.18394  ORF Transcript_11004/g.18394 Transcript_11004/m.18394 type:complete len:256 (+) Transcript_11004:267-1034(+)
MGLVASKNLREENRKRERLLKNQIMGKGGDLPEEEEAALAAKDEGFYMTSYMKQYNEMTNQDYSKGFEPQRLDDFYKEFTKYRKDQSVMPRQINFTFDVKFSGIEIEEEVITQIHDLLDKFQSVNENCVRPNLIKREYEKHKLYEKYPSLYSMVCWVTDANEFSGTESMTYQEFVQYAIFFFSQRYHEEGLCYIFQLLDIDNNGCLDKREFDEACQRAGLNNVFKEKIDEIFEKASSDGKFIKFSDFAFFMRSGK